MRIKAFKLNSFAKSIDGGNPAGVVIGADSLTEDQMKQIAGVLKFSETAFVMESTQNEDVGVEVDRCAIKIVDTDANTNDAAAAESDSATTPIADLRVRFFTPTDEVDLCGHATIGAYYAMVSNDLIDPGIYYQETKAGILKVQVKEDFSIMMDQTIPSFYEIISKEEIAASLNIKTTDIPNDLPIQVVSTGLKDIMVPVKSIDVLHGINPNFDKIEEISKKYGATGYHVFTLETLYHSNAHCRNFAPLYGIPEESATGTASGALACYLFKYGKINEEQAANIVFEQGYSMKKPSEIFAALKVDGKEIIEVKVGGSAMNLSVIDVEI
jgi:PhzF family phenazine biosynthesis protein